MYAIFQLVIFLIGLPLALSFVSQGHMGFHILEADHSQILFLRLLLHVIVSIRLVSLSLHPARNISSICFYLFVYIWIIAIPATQMNFNRWPWSLTLDSQQHLNILSVVLVSIAAFEIGMAGTPKRRQIYLGQFQVLPNLRILYLSFFLYSAIFIYFLFVAGELSAFFGARGNPFAGATDGKADRLIAVALFRTPIVVLSLILLSAYLSRTHKRIRHFGLLATACAIMLLISNFPTAQSRGRLGGVIIAFIAVWFFQRRPAVAKWFPVAMAAAILVLFPLLSQTRREVNLSTLDLSAVQDAYFQGSFDAYLMIGIIMDHAQQFGMSWGRQLLGALFFWVPRAIWDDKPIGTGAQVGIDMDLPFVNLSAPLWAEGYINFGLLGVIIAFFLLGRVARSIRQGTYAKGGPRMILGSFFAGFQFFLLRGDLMTSFTVLLPFVATTFAIFWRSRRIPLFRWLSAPRRWPHSPALRPQQGKLTGQMPRG